MSVTDDHGLELPQDQLPSRPLSEALSGRDDEGNEKTYQTNDKGDLD